MKIYGLVPFQRNRLVSLRVENEFEPRPQKRDCGTFKISDEVSLQFYTGVPPGFKWAPHFMLY